MRSKAKHEFTIIFSPGITTTPGLQWRCAISRQPEPIRSLEKHVIAPSAANRGSASSERRRQPDLLLVIFQRMPSTIIAFLENKSIAFTRLHKAAAFNMSRANNTGFELSGFHVLLKNTPDLINLFT